MYKMCKAVCVLGLLALFVGLAHSWDIAVSLKEQLVFYTNGTKTNTVNLISQNPKALVYDELHNMILYIDKQNDNDAICGYDLSSKDNKCFIKRNGRNIRGLAFDPVSDTIFFSDANEKSINYITMIPGHINNAYGNLLIKLESVPSDVVVDSCRGYIYWNIRITSSKNGYWERARFDGSDRKDMLTRYNYETFSLAIDLQTQKMFYFDDCNLYYSNLGNLAFVNLNGEDETILLNGIEKFRTLSKVLTVSKDYIYFTNSSEGYDTVWQLPKNARRDVTPKEIIKIYNDRALGITANYKINEQIKGIQNCDSLSSLIPLIPVAPRHTSERPDNSICENYCLQGNCSFNDEGLPKCSCHAGYSGNRCQVYACHGYCSNDGTCSLNEKSEPVCQCKGDYVGDRCELSACLNYCFQGRCSFNDDGFPKCSCNAGYSGERCEVNVCQGYCLNDGVCSLNEEDEPVCQCDGNHEGSRCESDVNDPTPKWDAVKRNLTLADLLSTWRKPSSKMYLTVEV